MISDDFLRMLRCPSDKMPLVRADEELVRRLNADFAAKQRKMTEGLVNESRTLLYPVFDGIPAMLADDAIRLDEGAGAPDQGPAG